MTIDGQFAAGLGLLALLTLSPGPTMALVSAMTVQHGRRAAFVTTLGSGTGLVVHGAASALGLSVVLAASPEAFTAVRLAGAVYLVYLGVRMILRRGRKGTAPALVVAQRDFYARGLITNLFNPKVAVFYLTFLPQFVHPADPVLAKSLLFATLHMGMVVGWFAVYAYGLARLAAGMRSFQPTLERISGASLIGVGVLAGIR